MATEPRLGTRIKRARERKRWTQHQLADALDVNVKTIDNWENDRTYPRSSIGALEDVLGIQFDDNESDADAADRLQAEGEAMIEAARRMRAARSGKRQEGTATYREARRAV